LADLVFNVAKGKVAEKVADDATKLGVLLIKAASPTRS
jgi:aspartate-semialdehyde dehydrogenase